MFRWTPRWRIQQSVSEVPLSSLSPTTGPLTCGPRLDPVRIVTRRFQKTGCFAGHEAIDSTLATFARSER